MFAVVVVVLVVVLEQSEVTHSFVFTAGRSVKLSPANQTGPVTTLTDSSQFLLQVLRVIPHLSVLCFFPLSHTS